MSGKPKLPKSSNRSKNCCLKVCITFLILVEMGVGVTAFVFGLVYMNTWDHSEEKNTEECKYYEGPSWGIQVYAIRRECSSSVSDTVSNHFQMPIVLGGVVFFSTGILQFATSDKPVYGLAFSIIALLLVMQPTVSITVDASNDTYAKAVCFEFLFIPFASIIYGLQQYELKKATLSPPEKKDTVV